MLSTRWRPQPASGPHASVAEDCAAEWQLVVCGRAHALIEGSKSALQQTILNIAADLPRPVAWWNPGATWPATAKTVIVEEVAALSGERQRELLERIASAGVTARVVATSSTPVYRAVCRGRFSSNLYYRLNTIRIHLT